MPIHCSYCGAERVNKLTYPFKLLDAPDGGEYYYKMHNPRGIQFTISSEKEKSCSS